MEYDNQRSGVQGGMEHLRRGAGPHGDPMALPLPVQSFLVSPVTCCNQQVSFTIVSDTGLVGWSESP